MIKAVEMTTASVEIVASFVLPPKLSKGGGLESPVATSLCVPIILCTFSRSSSRATVTDTSSNNEAVAVCEIADAAACFKSDVEAFWM